MTMRNEVDTLSDFLQHAEALQRLGAADANEVEKIRKITARSAGPDVNAVPAMTARQIRELREANNVSQAVFANILNTSVSAVQKWEAGINPPRGPALKLLNLIERKGLSALA